MDKMKTLRAKGAVILSFAFTGMPSIIFILLGADEFWKGDIKSGIFYIFVLPIPCILLGALAGIRIYRTHWIRYGEGKIIIRRVSKERVNGRPVGKWENREDEFLVQEIESYGLAWQTLGHYVEYHLSNRGKVTNECFFQIRGGKQVGFEMMYYTKKLQELFDYIYDETGIEFKINSD